MYQSSNSSYGAHYRHRGHSVNPKYSSLVRSKPTGLENLTNTCYISAVLQILFLILPENLIKNRGPITQMFFKLKQSKSTTDYKIFKRKIQTKIQIVQGYEQQDAQQFLIGFLELLNQENCEGLKRSNAINLDYDEKIGGIEANYKKFISQMMKIQNSKIIELFSAELVNCFTCDKKHKKFKFERYQCLSLNFPETPRTSSLRYTSSYAPVKLDQLINKHLQREQVSGLLCQKCKKRTQFTKQLVLYTTPRYLFLHLARFKHGTYNSQKINTILQYDEYLQIFDQTIKQAVKYRLLGTINHYGSLNRGHYYAQIRWKDGHWYQVNDQDVRTCQIEATGNRSKYVYILCYEKM